MIFFHKNGRMACRIIHSANPDKYPDFYAFSGYQLRKNIY